MVRLSVPAYATWTRNRGDGRQPAPRQCCFDEVASSLAERVPFLRSLRHLNATMPQSLLLATQPGLINRVLLMVDATLRGASQVVIINNPLSGALIVASLFFPSPVVGVHGVLGLLGATLAAVVLRL